jgi:N6-adenosine-specific RNA methylase IME4
MKLPISNIVILQRARKNAGDITALERSIQELGLLHPVVVTPDFALIAGYRRILAAKELGWTNIDVRVVESLTDAASELKAERDENTCRKDFCPSEAVALGERLEALERPKAKERQAAAGPKEGKGKKKIGSGKLPQAVGRTRDVVGAAVGMSGKTYQQAKAVIQAAAENPALLPIVEKMDATGSVAGAVRAVKRAQVLAACPALPTSKYRVLYADPPWAYNDKCDSGAVQSGGAEKHYPSMTIKELCAMPVRDLCDPNAVLFLWVTSPLLFECAPIIDAWGFEYKASFIWDKVKHNMGHYNSVRHELLLICTRGSCTPDTTKLFDSVQSIERTTHSTKPEEFREIIEELYPHGKRLELFARAKVKGWDAYGNEC